MVIKLVEDHWRHKTMHGFCAVADQDPPRYYPYDTDDTPVGIEDWAHITQTYGYVSYLEIEALW